MLVAIVGDIIGSVFERHNIKRTDFPLFSPYSHFTDDTVLTIAVADANLTGSDYASKFKEWYRLYPDRGYGPGFRKWAASDTMGPRYSMGNGAAMRVSPIGHALKRLDKVMEEAKKSTYSTHNHPEGIKGAHAISTCVYMTKNGTSKAEIKQYVTTTFGYRLDERIDEIRTYYRWDATCPGSVPQAITAFLESTDFEDTIRKAVSIGGDSDTIACMAGAIAEAYYGNAPTAIADEAYKHLDKRMIAVVEAFRQRYLLRRTNGGNDEPI
jgi:ADP-ribosylglycohydrolase